MSEWTRSSSDLHPIYVYNSAVFFQVVFEEQPQLMG